MPFNSSDPLSQAVGSDMLRAASQRLANQRNDLAIVANAIGSRAADRVIAQDGMLGNVIAPLTRLASKRVKTDMRQLNQPVQAALDLANGAIDYQQQQINTAAMTAPPMNPPPSETPRTNPANPQPVVIPNIPIKGPTIKPARPPTGTAGSVSVVPTSRPGTTQVAAGSASTLPTGQPQPIATGSTTPPTASLGGYTVDPGGGCPVGTTPNYGGFALYMNRGSTGLPCAVVNPSSCSIEGGGGGIIPNYPSTPGDWELIGTYSDLASALDAGGCIGATPPEPTPTPPPEPTPTPPPTPTPEPTPPPDQTTPPDQTPPPPCVCLDPDQLKQIIAALSRTNQPSYGPITDAIMGLYDQAEGGLEEAYGAAMKEAYDIKSPGDAMAWLQNLKDNGYSVG